jgi:hypothetical protein
MHGLTEGQTTKHSFVRSALVLFALLLLAALLLAPFSFGHSGSRGPLGLAVASLVCLFSGLAAEAVSALLTRAGNPLGGTMVGMAIRMFPPLAICVALATTGQSGRQHIYFIFYLLAFYMVMLAAETWIAVRRAASTSTTPRSPR